MTFMLLFLAAAKPGCRHFASHPGKNGNAAESPVGRAD